MTPVPAAVADQIAQLNAGIEQMRQGLLNRDGVEQIVAELLATERANPLAPGAGYRPGDYAPDARVLNGTFQERMAQLHTRDAGYLSPMVRQSTDMIREFQQRADDVMILDCIMSKGGKREYNVRESKYYREEFQPLVRALDTQTAGEGQEWVPTAMSNELVMRVNLALRIAPLFRLITMPTPTFDMPAVGVSRQRTGSHAEQTADTGQTKIKALTPGTRKVTLVAVKIAGRVLVSKEAEEDEIVAVLPWIRDELVDYLAADWDDTVLNGDTTGAHMDADVVAADDPRKLLIGLRKATQAGQKTDGANGALNVTMLRGNRRKMKKYGIDPSRLAHIVSMSNYIDLLGDPSVITVDKLGPNATILAGQLAVVDGAPLIVSEFARQDLNATGVQDGVTTNRSLALTVHTGGFVQGERRGITVNEYRELYAESDQDLVIASMRRAFKPMYPNATEPTVALTFNTAG